jgi:hypothetical protein
MRPPVRSPEQHRGPILFTRSERDSVCHRHESPGDVIGCGRLFAGLHPTPRESEKALCFRSDDFVEHAALAELRVRADFQRIGRERSPHAAAVTKVTKRLSARLQFDNPFIPKFCMLTCNSLILGVDNIQNQEYLPQRKKIHIDLCEPERSSCESILPRLDDPR